MKKILSLTLAAITAASVFAGCAQRSPEKASPIHAVSSSAESSAKWLRDRLGNSVNGDIFLATSDDADRFGIDISSLRDEGYVIRRNGGGTVILGSTEDGLDRGARYFANYCAEQDEIDVTYGEGFRVKKLTIAGRDISEYSIYLFPDADECHTFAAQELCKYIGLACGYYPNIVSEKRDHMIVLERLLVDPTLGEEGFTLSVKDDGNLYITGGKWRGCMYGVYELLERYIGWRFFYNKQTDSYLTKDADDAYYLYDSEHVDIPAGINDTQVPSFAYRQGRYTWYYNYDEHAKLRESRSLRNLSKYNGYGSATFSAAVHGFRDAVNAGVIPDYDYGGYDIGSPQPCYNNEEVIEAAKTYFLGQIEKKIASGYEIGKDITVVDVAQLDSGSFCKCKTCINAIAKERSGVASVLYFTNEMADAIGEAYPGLWVSMFAYYGTSTPPAKTMPRDNVNVSYCFYNDIDKLTCGNHTLDGKNCTEHPDDSYGTSNYNYAAEFDRWCQIAKRITVWYYPGNWALNSITNSTIKTMLKDMRYFSDNGVYGIYPCCSNPKKETDWESIDALMLHLYNRLLWNAEMTEEEFQAEIDDYLYVLYGEGGKFVGDYYKWLETTDRIGCWPFMIAFGNPCDRTDFAKVRDGFELCLSMFGDAIKYAPSAKAEYGVRLASRSMYVRGLISVYHDWYENGNDAQKARYTELWEYFRDLAVSSSYILSGGKCAVLSDFDISENIGAMVDRFEGSPTRVSDWYDWQKY